MKSLLTLLLPSFFFVLTYTSTPAEFTSVDLSIIACLFGGIFGVAVLIIRVFAQHLVVQNLILAGFTTVNILSVNLVLNEAFIGLQSYAQVGLLLLALFILFTFMKMLDENTRIAIVLPAIFALGTAGVLAQTLFSAAQVPVLSIERGKTSAKNIRTVPFQSKPNVYFISFDALIPKVLLKKHLGLETTAYHEVLGTHFRRFRNFFANAPKTGPSLNSLLALDLGHFYEASENNTARGFFAGLIPSPLFEIFKHNGYETTTLYHHQYFGNKKGPYVDNYRMNSKSLGNGVCEFIDTEGWRALTFMGYCRIVKSVKVRVALTWLGVVDQKQEPITFLIDHMRSSLKRDAPQIFLAYLFSPGHTKQWFDGEDREAFGKYRLAYLKSSEKTATQIMKIITFIDKEDPEAIVYLFGDHGPYLSRRETFEKSRTFFVQDRFGIYGGVYPRDRCDSFDALYSMDFMTIIQGAHLIIRCLSGGKKAFLTPEDYSLPEPITKDHNRYENYLYE